MKTFLDGRVVLHGGDCLEIVKGLADNSIDSVVTDPPYALVSITKRFGKEGSAPAGASHAGGAYARASSGFMGKIWDTGETAFAVEFWSEILRVLKPGGHVAAFGGTRSYHRLACAIEDAGFEIRDQLAWCYGTGFPKSHDVSKGIDKAAGAKGALGGYRSPDHAAPRKHHHERSHEGYQRPWQNDPEAVDATLRTYIPATDAARQWEGWGTALKPAWEPICLGRKPLSERTVAANVLRWGTGAINVDGCRVGPAVDSRRAKGSKESAFPHSDDSWRSHIEVGGAVTARFPANLCHDGSDEVLAAFPSNAGGGYGKRGGNKNSTSYGFEVGSMETVGFGDSGSAARFFYSAKASKADRALSKHPTVKPVKLMQWLVRLITPPGGVTLDPFSGTGTTGEAAWREGFSAVLIEREEEYIKDIERRMLFAKARPKDEKKAKPAVVAADDIETLDLLPLCALPLAPEVACQAT